MIALCARAGVRPASTLEVGCGDGALLCELHRRGFGGRLAGVEITDAAVAIARERPQIDAVARYDGVHLPDADAAHDLGILSHVLEHVPDPAALLAEVARACRAVLVEVPLEANLSARRSGKREHAAEVGHLQRLDRGAARQIVARAGLSIACELEDPLPLAVQRFFATRRPSRATPSGPCGRRCTAPRRRSRGGCSRFTTRACAWPASATPRSRCSRQAAAPAGRVAAANSSASTRPISSSGTALGVGELLARDAVGERVDRHRELLGGDLQLEVELAHAVVDQLRQQPPHLREARGDLRAHLASRTP